MTLMDEPCAKHNRQDLLLSHCARPDHPRVSVVVPVHPLSDAASTLERLPRLDGEVILVRHQAPLRAGLGAARGDCVVVLDPGADVGADELERFVSALQAGCESAQRSPA